MTPLTLGFGVDPLLLAVVKGQLNETLVAFNIHDVFGRP
jgi:hypothetical protein